MSFRLCTLSAAFLAASACFSAGTSRAAVLVQAEARPVQVLERRLSPGVYLEQYLNSVMAPFRQADTGGDGLDAADISRQRLQRLAQDRAQNIAQTLRYDLNADLIVTPDEFAALNPQRAARGPNPELDRFDVDGDGRVTVAEIVEASARISRVYSSRWGEDVADLMQLPEAQDGRLTALELEAAARSVFAGADLDHDGRISPQEWQRVTAGPAPERPSGIAYDVYCAMPPAEAKDLIVMYGAYEGVDARSGGGDQTGTATLRIEPGSRSIYLILPSYKAIRWTLTGAVGRVRQVVVSSYDEGDERTPRGTVGVAPQRVRVFGYDGCVRYFHELGSREADTAKAAVALRLGREPDVVAGAYKATEVNLPSGAPPAPKDPPKPPLGAVGVIDPARYASSVRIAGASFVATDENVNVFLNQPIASGRRYWEVKLLCGPIMTGVVADLTTAQHWGGHHDRNAGVYTWNPSAWPKPGGPGSERWPAATFGSRPTTGTIFGFALDADQKTLRLFMDGKEGPTVKLGFAGPYYPHSGFQIGFALPDGQPCPEGPASGEFLFRQGTMRYPPPQGYRLLGG